MKQLILDTNIVLRHPKTLSLGSDDFKIMITTDIYQELYSKFYQNNQIQNNSLLEVIEKAKQEKSILVINTSELDTLSIDLAQKGNLSEADLNLLTLGLMKKGQGIDISIATEDLELIRAAKSLNISTLRSKEVSEILGDKTSKKNRDAMIAIQGYIRSENKKIVFAFILGIIVSMLGVTIYLNISQIIATINVWGTIGLAIILGVSLFIFREKKKLAYGIAEFLLGVATVVVLFAPSFDYSNINFNASLSLKLFGALYLMVRGQDNIVKALNGSRLGFWIKDKFSIG